MLPAIFSLLLALRQPDKVLVGFNRETGEPIWLHDRDRAKHVITRGSSGSGKTLGILAPIVAQDILRGYHADVVIDPVGTLSDWLEKFLAALHFRLTLKARGGSPRINRRWREFRDQLFSKIHFVDLSRNDHGYHWNCLDTLDGNLSPGELAGDLLRVVNKVLQTDVNATRRMALAVRSAASIVSALHGTLKDLVTILSLPGDDVRRLVQTLSNRAEQRGRPLRLEFVRQYIDLFLAETAGRERRELIQSSWNLASVFLSEEVLYDLFDTPHGNLPIADVVQSGGVIILKCPDLDLNAQLVATSMLANRVQLLCSRRSAQDKRLKQVSLHIDEASSVVGNSPEWSAACAVVRNHGLALLTASQSSAQFLSPTGSDKLLREFEENCQNFYFFRLGAVDSQKEAFSVHCPDGRMVKVVEEEHSESTGFSTAKGTAKQVAETISHAEARATSHTVGHGSTTQVSVGKSDGYSATRVASLGFSHSTMKGQSRTTSNGMVITQSDGETVIETDGKAIGKSSGKTESEGHGSGIGSTSSEGSSESQNMFYSDGQSFMVVPMEGMPSKYTQQSGRGQGTGGSKSAGKSAAQTYHETHGSALSKGLTEVESATRGLASMKSRAVGYSKSTATSNSTAETDGWMRTLAQGISKIESYSRGLSKACQESESTSKATTATDSTGRSEGHTDSTQESESRTTSIAHRTTRYSIAEHAVMLSYDLMNLGCQDGFALERGKPAIPMRSFNLPMDDVVGLDGRPYTETLREVLRPSPVTIPSGSVFERFLAGATSDDEPKPPEGF
ncbi:MAG: hypothetical protein A2341_22355 [Deltaproteobacteria bacterium RIFOXYB12_FULL_58_9]|nr:MAG: hypothetical protein A2341_22355 [Deltaproteobacteria bacterium RIFOXYB12_FULL_58_9]